MSDLEGKPAPDFELQGSDGKTHRLADYSGRTLVIYFYPRDNTPGCTKEACAFRDMHHDLQDLGVVVLGVSRDSLAAHDKFIDKFGLPFVLLSDPETTMMQAYRAWGEKTLYGKLSTGCIRSTVVVGPDGKVRKHWPAVKKAAEHPEEVRAFLATV